MEDIYLECISKNDKKEIEFRTTNNEIFSYQTIIIFYVVMANIFEAVVMYLLI